MSRRALTDLMALARFNALLARGRWRRARLGTLGAGGLVTGGAAFTVTAVGLLVSSLVFCYVGQTLISSLLAVGRVETALGVARMLTDGCFTLALAALALSDAPGGRRDPRPLALLPLDRGDALLADLIGVLFSHPVALVLWPTAAALALAAWSVDAAAAVLVLPTCVGIVLLGAALTLALRGALASERSRRRQAASWLLRAILLASPVVWIVAVRAGVETVHSPFAPSPTPGRLAAASLAAAIEHSATSVAAGLTMLLAGLSVAVAAARWQPAPLPTPAAPVSPLRLMLAPPEAVLLWGSGRSLSALARGVAASGIVLVVASFASRQLLDSPLVPRVGALAAAWLLFSSISPVASNVLGQGGRAGASSGLLPVTASNCLLRLEVWAVAPAALFAVCGGVVVAAVFGGSCGLFAWLVAAGLLGATIGAGAMTSVLWPHSVGPARAGTDLPWAPGPSRLVLSLAHGAVLLTAASGIGAGLGSASVAAASGAVSAAVGMAVASRTIERRRCTVMETLLR